MAEESKQVDPTKERDAQEAAAAAAGLTAKDAGAESDEESGSEAENAAAQGAAAPGEGGEGAAKKKKKSKKKKAKQAAADAPASGSGGVTPAQGESDPKKAVDSLTPQQIRDFIALNPALANELAGGEGSSNPTPHALVEAFKKLKLQDIMTGLASSGKNRKDMASYKFWSTQPVPQFGEEQTEFVEEGPLKIQEVKDISTEPIPLALEPFRWVTMDLTNEAELEEVERLLYGHYVEDDDAMFRFKYSSSLLRWQVQCSVVCGTNRQGWRVADTRSPQVAAVAGLEEGMARRHSEREHALRLHLGHSDQHQGARKGHPRRGGQLPLHPQEAEGKAARPRPH